jgi:hypothetical protein
MFFFGGLTIADKSSEWSRCEMLVKPEKKLNAQARS